MQYLRELGFNPVNESIRLRQLAPEQAHKELTQNIDFFVEHVLRDQPVSDRYFFWPDSHGNLYSHPDRNPRNLMERQADSLERGGMMVEGLRRLSESAIDNDGVVLHYSPKGKASFGDDGYEVDPYPTGHLGLHYFDGEKVCGVGIMISNEDLLLTILSRLGLPLPQTDDQEEFITHYLMNPLSTNLSPDDFLQNVDSMGYSDRVLYKDKNNYEHTLGQILMQTRQAIDGKRQNYGRVHVDKTVGAMEKDFIQEQWTKDLVQRAYVQVILDYASERGISKVQLMGSCGGKVQSVEGILNMVYGTKLADILSPDFLNPVNIMGLHSSILRMLRSEEPFECPGCNAVSYTPVGDECPSCHITKEEATAENLPVCPC